MADKIFIIEDLKDEIDTFELQVRDFVIDWYTIQFTQENCEQVNDMLYGFLSELDYLKSIVDTNLPVLEKQITNAQDALAHNLFHAKYESFMQVMNGLATHLLTSLSNPETYFCEEYYSHLVELATKFGHYPQWTQCIILNKVLDLLSDNSDLPRTPGPTPMDTQDNTPHTFENAQEVDSLDQTLDTLDNAPTPPNDTPRHPMVYPDFELDPKLDVDIDFEPDDEFDFNMPQDIVPTETPSDPSETNDNRHPLVDNYNPSNNQNLNGPPDIDVESNIVTDSDFDADSDSDLDSDIEDIEGTFLTMCEEIKKNIPPRRSIPLISFG